MRCEITTSVANYGVHCHRRCNSSRFVKGCDGVRNADTKPAPIPSPNSSALSIRAPVPSVGGQSHGGLVLLTALPIAHRGIHHSSLWTNKSEGKLTKDRRIADWARRCRQGMRWCRKRAHGVQVDFFEVALQA